MTDISQKILNFIDLHKGEENKKSVIENITSAVSFRGSNIWILACAIIIASVGLNVNSTAVIIGAMLISPLMGPIVGAGFGLGMYDFELLKKSIKNLIIATLVSLITSTIYFYASPFKEAQSELLARTSPNIYDILIAFFGGLVGVIAVTRVEKGNPIPGVAIATALMPPLCTAGYSLALGNYIYFLGAMYLYTINCVFICIATFVIVKYLKYPIAKQLDLKHEKRVKYGISVLTLLLILPSIYFAFQLYDQKSYNSKVEVFLQDQFHNKDYPIIYKKIRYNADPKKIELAFLSKKFTDAEIAHLNKKLGDYELPNTKLIIRQDTVNLRKDILNQINSNQSVVDKKDVIINNLQNQLSQIQFDKKQISNEAKILFPTVTSLTIGNYTSESNANKPKIIPIVLFQSKKNIDAQTQIKMKLWLKERLAKDSIEVYQQN
ncbi:TIGR00341 family protein [Flavobacterium aquidurense]|uniref:TIGR00341 family protein n=1 Tax=Flavobacterium aquidurense TaxID=362413 RepID=UPI00285506DB|nr:TIGR00341 family protein [Flavobacterium aquidurense]MDR7370754.1 putative hydrophobic protein (TIGR00271 family) [Flavobacterium aquidurense]